MPSFRLSGRGLQNLNWELLNDDFYFIIDEPFTIFSTNKILADFISPKVANLHLAETTLSEYHIQKCDPDTFNSIIKLLKGEKVEFDYQSLAKVYEIGVNLGNQEIIKFVEKFLNGPLSIDNVVERILQNVNNQRYLNSELIGFASTNICEIPKSKLFQLDVDSLSMILSSEQLSIFSEDYLFNLICELFEYNSENAELFQYVIFSNLREESLSKFIALVPFEYINSRIWNSLLPLFVKTPKDLKRSNSNIDSSFNFGRYKKLFFDYDEVAEFEFTRKQQNSMNRLSSSIDDNQFNLNDNQLESHTISMDDLSESISKADDEKMPNKFNGIIKYLSNKFDGNVSKLGVINITSSGVNKNHANRTVDWTVEFDDPRYFQSNNEPNAWICFDFKDMSVCPTKYALKSRADFGRGSDHLKSWVVEGSNDKQNWTMLDERDDPEVLNGAGFESVFKMNAKTEKSKFFRYLRIMANGPMVSGYYNMTISSIEFYGYLIGC